MVQPRFAQGRPGSEEDPHRFCGIRLRRKPHRISAHTFPWRAAGQSDSGYGASFGSLKDVHEVLPARNASLTSPTRPRTQPQPSAPRTTFGACSSTWPTAWQLCQTCAEIPKRSVLPSPDRHRNRQVIAARQRLLHPPPELRRILRGSLIQRPIRHRQGCPKCARSEGHPVWVLTVGYPGVTHQISLRQPAPTTGRRVESWV